MTVTPTPYRIIAPLEALFIIGWWAYDLIDGEAGDEEKWYEFGRETLVITVVQVTMATSNSHWRDLILLLFICLFGFVCYRGAGSKRFLIFLIIFIILGLEKYCVINTYLHIYYTCNPL